MNDTRFAARAPRVLFFCVLLLTGAFITMPAQAATLLPGFTESLVASGLSNATAMQFAPDGRLFVCQQGGALRVIKSGVLLATPFVTLSVDSEGERGLLGVAFDPNFSINQFVYVYYTVPGVPAHNRVRKLTANGDVAAAAFTDILDLENLTGATNHNGGAINFGPDGKLYVAVGENANGDNAQSLDTRLGKMLRINSDSSIPLDNPCADAERPGVRAQRGRGHAQLAYGARHYIVSGAGGHCAWRD